MKIINYVTLLVMMIFISSCSDDDPSPTLDVVDFATTVDENQAANVVLGSVTATGTDGTFAYSITSQSPGGSLAIDAATGEISVADVSAFDFETNPTITATISVIGNSITETTTATITLNDIDDLEFLLSDSKTAYTAAADGDWVEITAVEYTTLTTALNEVSKVGGSDDSYNMTPSGRAGNFTLTNTAGPVIPMNSYVFAVKYKLDDDDSSDLRIKQSFNTISEGYSDLGGILTANSAGENFMILKGNDSTNSSTGYLAMFGVEIGYLSANLGGLTYGNGDINLLERTQSGSFVFFQGLSTTQKQW